MSRSSEKQNNDTTHYLTNLLQACLLLNQKPPHSFNSTTSHISNWATQEKNLKKTFFDIEAKESSNELRFRLKEMVQNGGGELENQQRTQNGES